jgi:hypothetical protein
MAAATAGSNVGSTIASIVARKHVEFEETNTLTSEPHVLRFTFDGVPFETTFAFQADKWSGVLTNHCIFLTDLDELESSISANSPEKNCFRPLLIRSNLPEGVTPTDVLQVLSTKLKFTALPEKELLTITDAAKLPAFKTKLSAWRLVRGESSLYEKYGYLSRKRKGSNKQEFEIFRTAVTSTVWGRIMDFPVNDRTLQQITDEYFPGIFNPAEPIATCMKRVSLEDAERFVIRFPDEEVTIVELILVALERKKIVRRPSFIVEISRTSPLWQSWDARLVFESFTPATMGGGGGRKHRKTRKAKKTKR